MSSPASQGVQGPWTITYSNANISQSNSTFYYDTQFIHFLANFDLPLVNATLGTVDASYWYNTACAINFGAQTGACGVMFFVVLVLSQAAKRRTPIFILNVLSLMFGFFRGLFFALFFTSDWVKIYPYFSNDYSAIPIHSYVISVLGAVVPLLMTITVNLSLVLQAYTVTKNIRDLYRYMIIAVSSLVFFMAVGFEFAEVVLNCIAIVQAKYYAEQWVQHGALYMETISVWYFSVIFTSKLVYTLHYRRKHGWKQWSGVKILAAMGGCTMVIPCEYSDHPFS
jgi:pheromone alpha factor receptor